MPGSDDELVPLPEELGQQMREATERLRDQTWMVAPFTGLPAGKVPLQVNEQDVDH